MIIESDTVHAFGEPPTPQQPAIVLRVVNANFWCRIYTSHDLGCKNCHNRASGSHANLPPSVAEAYMHGDFLASPSAVKAVLDVSY